MILGVMQPYFFPYLGYFDLISRSDQWIVFDTPQYMRQGWVNRNRILHPRESWQYIIAPLKHHTRETPINQVETVEAPDWRRKVVNQFTHYRGRAPFYREVIALVEECLTGGETRLCGVNIRSLGKVCKYLGIKWAPHILSEMGLPLGPITEASDWAVQIAVAAGASEYINPPGGAALYSEKQFTEHGITLCLQEDFSFSYACPGYTFIPKLSVLDVLMWVSAAEVKLYLDANKAAARDAPASMVA